VSRLDDGTLWTLGGALLLAATVADLLTVQWWPWLLVAIGGVLFWTPYVRLWRAMWQAWRGRA
jgi:hypothetical protein